MNHLGLSLLQNSDVPNSYAFISAEILQFNKNILTWTPAYERCYSIILPSQWKLTVIRESTISKWAGSFLRYISCRQLCCRWSDASFKLDLRSSTAKLEIRSSFPVWPRFKDQLLWLSQSAFLSLLPQRKIRDKGTWVVLHEMLDMLRQLLHKFGHYENCHMNSGLFI